MKENKELLFDNSQFIDDTYQVLDNEFTQIRSCIGMYISKKNTEGALHLIHELVNNAIDECINEHSPSDKIYVTFKQDKREFTITDEGRGIPIDKLVEVCTKKHSSTKFVVGEKRKGTAGLNGVGMTVTAALTDYMSVTSYRGNVSKTIEFIDGELRDNPVEKLKKSQHGLSVKIIPSEKYLGEIDLKLDMIEEYLRRLSYIIPENIKITLYGSTSEEEPMITRKYNYQGLSANVEFISESLEFKPIDINFSNEDFDLSLSFSYDKSLDESIINSYCNYIYTTEGGNHEVACQRAICDYFTREAKKMDPNNKFEVAYEDCKKGLILCVNCNHVDPAFEGQHKSKVSNKDVLQDGKRGIVDKLNEYFTGANNAQLRKIITYLRQISKARMESNKIKGVTMKKKTTFLDDAQLKGFVNISNRNYTGYRELLITEGDSALGAILNSRNPKNQAVFAVMGVTDNVHGLTPAQLLQKKTFRDLIEILGCGIGKDFDINKLKWNKIIILTDADIDGSNITSLLLCFFLLFMKPLIDEGKIYKSIPPLYLLEKKSMKRFYKGNEWLFDKKEYYDLLNNLIIQNVDVKLEDPETKNIVDLSKSELKRWLEMNSEYLLELDNLVKRAGSNPQIVESSCWYKLITNGNEELFKELIEKEFDELKYDLDDQSLYGSYNSESISLITDKLFLRVARRFMNILSENPAYYLYCKNKNDDNDKYDRMSIGAFLRLMNRKFNVEISQRFKGLGEAEADILFVTTMNPKMRKLIRLNIGDIQETNQVFNLLHGKSNEMREKRRELLENTNISYADIDN